MMKSLLPVTDNSSRTAPLEMSADSFRQHGYFLVDKIAVLFDSLGEKPVTTGKQPAAIRSILGDASLPLTGSSLDEIFNNAVELLSENSLYNGSPRFWGYITGAPAPAAVLADLLASAVNANVGANILSPMATEIELQCIKWIAELIGFKNDCGGIFVSGGNMANITGLLTARKAKANWDIRQSGLNDKGMLIYCSKSTHTWVSKAADLLGFGTDSIRWIETNEQDQMDVLLLERQVQFDLLEGYRPFVVVGTAGAVSTGAVDPLDKIAAVCTKYSLWFHVDGAYGAPAVIVPEVTHLFNGMELADSVALDPHKWLYSPLEAGCLLVKNKQALHDTYSFHPAYYNFDGPEDDRSINFHEFGFQNSRGFRALKVWILLQQAGKNGYRKMINDDIKLAKKLFTMANSHRELQAISCNLSIVTFRFIPDNYISFDPTAYLNRLNEEIVNRTQAGGEVFVSNALVDGRYCLRACIVNFRTQASDIETLVNVVVRTGRAVRREWQEKAFKHNNSDKPTY